MCFFVYFMSNIHTYTPHHIHTGGRLDGEVECDFAVIEGVLFASLISKEMATVGPSARINGDVIYNVLELDRV